MKSLIAIAVLLMSLDVIACDRPYEMKLGHAFKSASIVSYWSDFAAMLSEKLKCPVKITTSPSFKSYLIDLINKDGDLFLVAGYYAHPLEKLGLIPVLKVTTPAKYHLITKKHLDPKNLKTLKGKTIHVASIYSTAYAISVIRLQEAGVINQVNFEFGDSYQANIMKVINSEADAAVMFSPIFDALSKPIKDKLNTATLLENTTTGYAMVHPDSPAELIEAIQTSHHKINLLKWSPTNRTEPQGALTDMFNQQLLDLIEEKNHQRNN
jgi:ABC-type phosphate/phosphonate transport system substrate-binding protein